MADSIGLRKKLEVLVVNGRDYSNNYQGLLVGHVLSGNPIAKNWQANGRQILALTFAKIKDSETANITCCLVGSQEDIIRGFRYLIPNRGFAL